MAVRQTQFQNNATLTRMKRVASLSTTSRSPKVIAEILSTEGIVNPHTGKSYSTATVRSDLKVISEMIGRSVSVNSFWQAHRFPFTVDEFRTQYDFWDRLRNCKAEGYELSGLFVRPITQILASYVFGERPTYTIIDTDDLDEDRRNTTDALIAKFLTQNHARLLAMLEDLYALGDQFVVVNADGTLSIPSPDTVVPEYDPLDYRRLTKVTITTRSRGVIVIDEYRDDGRTLTIQKGSEKRELYFENLLGRIPIVHLANNRRSNELYGRPEVEALLPVLSAYDDLLDKMIGGMQIVANPIPVFEGMENITETIAANATPQTETYTDIDGNNVNRQLIAFDTLGAVFAGKGGQFNFKSPPVGFTKDGWSMLEGFFKLILQHTRIPEVTWGSQISGSNATAAIQMPPYVRFINAKRVTLDGQGFDDELGASPRGGMYEIIDLFLRMRRLTDPDVVVAPLTSKWASVDLENEQIKMQKVIYAKGVGLLDRAETLELLNIVADSRKSVERADVESAAQPQEQGFMGQLNAAARQDMNAQNSVQTPTEPKLKEVVPPDPDGGRNVRLNNGKPVGEMRQNNRKRRKNKSQPVIREAAA